MWQAVLEAGAQVVFGHRCKLCLSQVSSERLELWQCLQSLFQFVYYKAHKADIGHRY